MSRFGVVIGLLILLAVIGFAAMVHVTGPVAPASPVRPVVAAGAPTAPFRPKGPLRIPVEGVAASALHDDWAEPRGGGTRLHHAIDIMAPAGTPVLAAADGRIEKLFHSRLGGNTIYQRSAEGGTVYYYAHLDRYAPMLVEGQPVHAGQEIGGVGSTGDADPGAPHLHFEVHRMAPGDGWWQGLAVDPYPLLAGR